MPSNQNAELICSYFIPATMTQLNDDYYAKMIMHYEYLTYYH